MSSNTPKRTDIDRKNSSFLTSPNFSCVVGERYKRFKKENNRNPHVLLKHFISLVFLCEIETRLRPDMVMFSTAKKLLIIVELTVPWESRIDEAFERKKLKYSDLCDSCREKGWSVWCYPVEVGCCGFVGTSTIRALRLRQIGLTGKERTKAVNEISEVA